MKIFFNKRVIILLVAILLLICGGLLGFNYYHSKQSESKSSDTAATATKVTASRLTVSSNEVKTLDYSAFNITKVSDIYTADVQNALAEQISKLKAENTYSFDDMLILSNPYLTNTTGLYLYFSTDTDTKISYKVEAEGYETFTEDAKSSASTYSQTHEFQLIGSVAGVKNTITITATKEDGTKQSKIFIYTPPKLFTLESNTYSTEDGTSKQTLSDGLFVVIGDSTLTKRSTYYVDNSGVIRGEIPINSYNSMRLNFTDDNQMYLAISSGKIVRLNALGQMTQLVSISSSDYKMHHDFVLDADGNILALAESKSALEETKHIEDRIIKINTETNQVTELVNFETLMPDLYEVATGIEKNTDQAGNYDTVHLNTIQYLGDDSIIVSSRETSTILKLTNVTSTPKIQYMMADESVWKGVGDYSSLLLNKSGDFISQSGQHSVTYETSDDLAEDQYYLYMFDNNSQIMYSRPDFSWEAYARDGETSKKRNSYYYKYLVDENSKTYKLVQSFAVPYSAYVSSVEDYKGNIVIDIGQQGFFSEYDSEGKLIKIFTNSNKADYYFVYRTYKYGFNSVYFE